MSSFEFMECPTPDLPSNHINSKNVIQSNIVGTSAKPFSRPLADHQNQACRRFMQEPIHRRKLLFWSFFLSALALAAVPSVILVESTGRYLRFLSGWNPGVLQAGHTHRLPHRGGAVSNAEPQIHFVEFRLRAPKAKRVLLAGDFNRWKPETLPLSQKSRGIWEIQVPLPPGKYLYLFQVDGAWTLDPGSPGTDRRGGLTTSVRQVPQN